MIDEPQLMGPPWQVETLNGKPVGNATLTLNFHEPGKLAGKAACNNYMASYSLTEDGLSVQTGGVTMMACPEPLMTLEHQFLDGLEKVKSATLDHQGALLLSGENGVILRTTR
ncbi:MAG: META domain-containing protein [Pseudomonadales bacterium]|nr:META domain-containing protein [Pseudomonadales bacterium]